MSTTISVKYPIIGAKVVRGKDWTYGNQDGGEGKTGVIIEKLHNNWVRVLWENGSKDGYSIGNVGKYDLYFENYKDSLLQDAMEKFPSGCSYIGTSEKHYKNIEYEYPYWYGYDEKMIALKKDEGLVYKDGVWATRTDVPVKELSPLEKCKQMYSVGDVVETTMGSTKFTETITQKILDNLKDTYTKGFISCTYLNGWLYNGETQEYAKIINKPINTNKNVEKSKSNPSESTTNVECNVKRASGIEVSRPYIKIPTTVRSGGVGLKSADCKVRFGSNSSYYQKRLSIS